MDLYLQTNDNLRPREEVRIERVAATYPSHQRVKVEVVVTPFRERPNLEITIRDVDDQIVSSASVVALMNFNVAFNLHLRGIDEPTGDYAVQVQLYYDDVQVPQDMQVANLHIAG